MCGIAGILRAPGERVDPADLQAMAGALAHRGPDDEGFHVDGNLGLAHRRLSILDLSPAGHQPLSNEDGTVWVAYNGQLYDFAPTRSWLESRGHRFRSRTDTEVLVHLYEEKGEDLLEDVDGMFAFALWDARRRRLLLARDRLGIKPLFYVQHGPTWAFASELKALQALPELPVEVDRLALVQYLYQSSVPGGTSILKSVRKLGPAQCLVIENGGARLRTYWSVPAEVTSPPESFAAACASFESRLATAVRSHLVADVPVGTFLSGGLDSTAVSKAARASIGELQTFSVRFEGPARHDEGPGAREVAEALGTIHHELVVGPAALAVLPDMIRHADEPFAISSALALYLLARFARECVKVVLTGDGADEVLAGYPWRHEPEIGAGAGPLSLLRGLALTGTRSVRGARSGGPGLAAQARARLGRLFRHPDERYAEIVDAFTPEEMDALLAPDLREMGRRAWDENPVRLRYAGENARDPVNRRLRADLATTLVDEMLTKVDRMTMAAGLEARVPFLDRALVEWAFRLPGRYKVRRGVGKRLLRRALAPTLPRAARRPKHGFDVPLGDWLRGPLRPMLLDTLTPAALRRRGLVRADAVERMIRAHLDGRGDHSRKLFTMLVLEEWLGALGQRTAPAARRAHEALELR
ncbi:MAG TPA: asparagine synthase (glutamine-hydrolyzing), partial [Vicinamibacteria bacterium]